MKDTTIAGYEEKYSSNLKKMSQVTKAFSKDEEELETGHKGTVLLCSEPSGDRK